MSDDLIKRSDAIKAVSKVNDYGDGIGFEVRSHCLVELQLVPSADRSQAEWIDKGNWMGIECSRCKCHSRYVTPFCPQCGARMKEADDE